MSAEAQVSYPKIDVDVLDMLVNSSLLSRERFVRQFMDSRKNRDVDDECGYPKTNELTPEHYALLYSRESVATRVVDVWPDECWKIVPEVFEDPDPDKETEFEAAWKALDAQLNGGESKFKDEKGSPIWEYLKRIDKLSGVGSYGVLLLGLSDGEDLSKPVTSRKGLELLYVRCFDEALAQIASFETDPSNRRYGQPNAYNLTFYEPTTQSTIGSKQKISQVHWSRCVHVADNLMSSEVFGMPRMQTVYNRLYDLRKMYGGCAEMYWRGAFPGLSFETHPSLGGDVTVDETAVKEKMQLYMQGLQRYFLTQGLSVKSLSPQVVDPSPQIDKLIEAICIKLAIPKRVFMGSERGELASGQDADTWEERVQERRTNHVTPRVIVPFIDRLVALGVLPMPKEYGVGWSVIKEVDPEKRASTAAKTTEALAKYVQGGVESLVPPKEYLTRVLDMDEDDVEQILEAAAEHVDEMDALAEEDMVDDSQPVEDGPDQNGNPPQGDDSGPQPQAPKAEKGSAGTSGGRGRIRPGAST